MFKKIPAITITIIVIMATVGVVAALAGAFNTGPLVPVSSTSPFAAGCGNFPGLPPGNNFPNSEVEPWMDVSPVNSNIIAASWQQDRWSNGGSRGLVAGVSIDGGANWDIVPVPGVTDCTGGKFQRASDPWVTFAANGDLYHMSLALDIDTPPNRPGGFGPNAMLVSKVNAADLANGLQMSDWHGPITLMEDTNARFLNDKNSITADPVDSNYVYAVWDRLQQSTGDVINPERVPGNLAFKGPAVIARTTDGGQTWGPVRRIYDPGGINQTLGNQVVVLPDGTVVDFFDELLAVKNPDGGLQGDANLALKRSPDKGATWLPNGQPIRTNKILAAGTVTPDGHDPVRSAAFLFDVAVDPESGALYAVWQDARFSGFDQVAFSQSTDGGFTWSKPIRANGTPANGDNPLRQQAFLPSVAVADGVVGVTYYDFRNDDGTSELVDHWLIHCHGGCTDTANWGGEVRVTDASFDIRNAPLTTRGPFLGDYVGLASDGTNFLTFFQQSAADPASGFFRQVGP